MQGGSDEMMLSYSMHTPQRRRRQEDEEEADDDVFVPPTPLPSNHHQTRTRRRNNVHMWDRSPSQSLRDGQDASIATNMTGYGSWDTTTSHRLERIRKSSGNGADGTTFAAGGGNNDAEEMQQPQHQQQQQEEERREPLLPQEEEEEEEQGHLIRGTNIVVSSAARTFKEFLQNFISVEESERVFQKEQRQREREMRKRAAAGGGGGGGGGGNDDDGDDDDNDNDDDDSLESIDTHDSTEQRRLVYMDKIRNILFQRPMESQGGGNDGGDAMTSSSSSLSLSQPPSSSLMGATVPLDLDAKDLYYHSPSCQRLYHQLVSYPAEVIPLMDLIVGREMEAMYAQLCEEMEESSDPQKYLTLIPRNVPLPKVQVRPFNLKTLSHMRALDPNSIDNLLSIRGMVVRTSPIIPDLKVAHFTCTVCSHVETITLERGRISEPTVCLECNVKNGFELVHNRCMFADKQMVRIQETPNEVPAGETPASIVLFSYDDLVDAVRPGDRVEVTGVFRAQAKRVNPKISKVKSVYKTYVDVVHYRRVSGDSTTVRQRDKEDGDLQRGKGILDNVGGKISSQRMEELMSLARSPDIYDRLVQSLAPSIWELDDVKKGVLCMLFGGNSKRVKKGTNRDKKDKYKEEDYGSDEEEDDDDEDKDEEDDNDESDTATKLNKRGDINILLCGDPGTSKSQLLSYVHKLSPRGVYTSGKGSSAVGLTASIVRDPETRDLVLESGALVLSDLGICCIDEFDKMSDTTRAILHEAMEQQTVSIAKAGIIATLNARTSILASANPVESRYNPKLSVVENIKLPPTLLSRFDLIYLILDSPNIDNDRRLAQHLVGLYYETPNVVQPPLDHSLLRDYISYAREYIHPELSDLATRELITAYLDMRKIGSSSHGNNGSRTISATPRQLESLIRLSEAIAKMRFSMEVTRADVREAVRLMKVATQAAATDPRTGRIDMDMITTGRSTANREMEEALSLSLRELLAERRGSRMAVGDVRRQLSEIMNVQGLKQEDVIEALRSAEGDGLIQLNERAQTIFVRQGVVS